MSTKIKTVYGMVSDGLKMHKMPITVRFTHDKRGKTLSLQTANIMLTVPYEEIESLIKAGGHE